jgi:hypothetical protein
MISESALNFFGNVVNSFFYMRVIPFYFDFKSKTLHVTESKRFLLIMHISSIITALYSIYSCYILLGEYSSSLNEFRDYLGLAIPMVWTGAYAWGFIIHFCQWSKRYEIASYFNQIVEMDKRFQSNYTRKTYIIKYYVFNKCFSLRILQKKLERMRLTGFHSSPYSSLCTLTFWP